MQDNMNLEGLPRSLAIPFNQTVSEGLIEGYSVGEKFGENDTVGTSFETIWTNGGLYTWQAAAVILGVSSSSAADDAAGTGARTIRITGLDGNYAEITEDVILDGQTKVETTQSFLRVNDIKVLTAGTGGSNAGVLYVYDTSDTVTSGVPQTATKILNTVKIGDNQAQSLFYTVPAGKTAYLVREEASAITTGTADVRGKVLIRLFGELFQVKTQFGLSGQGSTHFTKDYVLPKKLPEKTDIEVQALISTGTGAVSGSLLYNLTA